MTILIFLLPGVKGLQRTNGSPVMSFGQLQTATSPRSSQFAFIPHESKRFLNVVYSIKLVFLNFQFFVIQSNILP